MRRLRGITTVKHTSNGHEHDEPSRRKWSTTSTGGSLDPSPHQTQWSYRERLSERGLPKGDCSFEFATTKNESVLSVQTGPLAREPEQDESCSSTPQGTPRVPESRDSREGRLGVWADSRSKPSNLNHKLGSDSLKTKFILAPSLILYYRELTDQENLQGFESNRFMLFGSWRWNTPSKNSFRTLF